MITDLYKTLLIFFILILVIVFNNIIDNSILLGLVFAIIYSLYVLFPNYTNPILSILFGIAVESLYNMPFGSFSFLIIVSAIVIIIQKKDMKIYDTLKIYLYYTGLLVVFGVLSYLIEVLSGATFYHLVKFLISSIILFPIVFIIMKTIRKNIYRIE